MTKKAMMQFLLRKTLILTHLKHLSLKSVNLMDSLPSRPFVGAPLSAEVDLEMDLKDLPPLVSEDEEEVEEEVEDLQIQEDLDPDINPPQDLPVGGEVLNPPNNEDLPVGARLAQFAPAWAHLFGPESRPARTVSMGVGLTFKSRPKLTRHPVQFMTHSSLDGLRRATTLLEQKKVIVPVRDRSSLGFYSRLFLVPKRSGEDRPIIDLSPLNRQLVVPSFKMETQQSVRAAVRPREWTTSIDIRDAYLHVPMAQSAQRYLRFRVGHEVHQFRSLPFGLSTSPREFTKILQPVVQLLRAHGVRLHAYLDDWLIRADSPQQARHDAYLVANVLQTLGWIVNREKSNFVPSQDFVFLGIHFNTASDVVIVRPSEDIRDRLDKQLQKLKANPEVTATHLASIFGLLQYMAPMVPLGRMRLRPIQWRIKSLWNQATGQWTDRVVLPQVLLRKLQWWISQEALKGVPSVSPEAQLTMFTDASSSGWGAVLNQHRASGIWSKSQARLHINALEIQAVWQALKKFSRILSGKAVRVMIDNRTVVAYIRRFGGTHSKTLNDLALKVQRQALNMNTILWPVFIQGYRNVTADSLSRRGQTQETEWSLNHSVLQKVFEKWGQPWLDLFATRDNKQLDQFVSPFPDPEAYQVDALSFTWEDLGLIYAFPPSKIVPEVIRKFRNSSGTQMILIAPLRAASSWTPELIQLSRSRIRLGKNPDLLSQTVQGKGLTFHGSPVCFNLHAWLL